MMDTTTTAILIIILIVFSSLTACVFKIVCDALEQSENEALL